MNFRDIAVVVFLSIGVLGFVFTAIGLLFTRDVYDQIQFLAPSSLIGAVAIAMAVFIQEGFHQAGLKGLVIAGLLFWANPVLSHATARAARIRHKGQWQPTPEEEIPTAEEEA